MAGREIVVIEIDKKNIKPHVSVVRTSLILKVGTRTMGLLKGISHLISADLLHVLASMGHGDKIVFADANFPSHSICQGAGSPRYVAADGITIPELLSEVEKLLPIEGDAIVMEAPKITPNIWGKYAEILHTNEDTFLQIERFKFYEAAKHAYAVVHTGERALYGNIILTKGVIP